MKCLENVGMLSTTPIEFEGHQIVPIQFLALLPDHGNARSAHQGQDQHRLHLHRQEGRQGKDRLISTTSGDHEECYREVGSQAISYTTGVPAMIGAAMLLTGKWNKPGVYTVEEFDPDPYMEALNKGVCRGRLTTSRCWWTDMKFTELPTPRYLLDENRLVQNLAVLRTLPDAPARRSCWRRRRSRCFRMAADSGVSGGHNGLPVCTRHGSVMRNLAARPMPDARPTRGGRVPRDSGVR